MLKKAHENDLNIILFEDNAADAKLVADYLDISALPHQLTVVKRLSEGAALLKSTHFDLVLLDLALADSQGLETLRAVSTHLKEAVIIVLTDTKDEQLSLDALKAGAQDYLFKDTLNAEMLRRAIRYAIERGNMLRKAESHAVEIRHCEILLRRIFAANTDAMLILTPEHEIRFLNPAAGELLEATTDSLVGEIFPFELNSGQSNELKIPGPNNSTRFVEIAAVDLIWEGASALVVILRDVSKQKQAERDLKSEKERLSFALDSIASAVITVDNHGLVERINQEAARITGVGYTEAIGTPLGAVLRLQHPRTGKLITNPLEMLLATRHKEISPELGIHLIQNEKLILVNVAIRATSDDRNLYGCVIILHDISRQKQAEEELLKSEKLRSISLLAGGIAHDFNNILTAILGNISVVRLEMASDNKHATRLHAAEKAALQAASLTNQLLTFSKGETPVLRSTTVTQLIEDCAQFILRGSNVRCEIEKSGSIWPVDADQGQIAQVINNLIINADQAMPSGGMISIKLTNCKVNCNEISELDTGQYIKIAVNDQGTGITPENLKCIFAPYFTTKADGNGLGLASSYSIIKSHRGTIVVESQIGVGSAFNVYLPKSKQGSRVPFEIASRNVPESSQGIEHGHGRILVMDDMEAMMTVASEIITMLGYEVECSTNGKDAIDAYKAAKNSGNPFDAVVFDLTVPGGMGGEEAAGILLKYDPKLLAIASSGYSTSNVMADYKDSPFTAVVPKPYRIKEMSDALHQVLKDKPQPSA